MQTDNGRNKRPGKDAFEGFEKEARTRGIQKEILRHRFKIKGNAKKIEKPSIIEQFSFSFY